MIYSVPSKSSYNIAIIPSFVPFIFSVFKTSVTRRGKKGRRERKRESMREEKERTWESESEIEIDNRLDR